MERSYIYDIRTSENAMTTLVNFTGVVPPIWEKNKSKRNQFQFDEELVEYVLRIMDIFLPFMRIGCLYIFM